MSIATGSPTASLICLALAAAGTLPASAQQLGLANARTQIAAPRPLGPVLRVTAADLLGSVSAARILSDGHVIVSDLVRRRILLLDPTLALQSVVRGSKDAASSSGQTPPVGVFAYFGDSTLIAEPATLSMVVLDSAGREVRVIAGPRTQDASFLIGGPYGTPAIDRAGRLVFRGFGRAKRPVAGSGTERAPIVAGSDSAPIIRMDLATRKVDTVSMLRVFRTDMSAIQTRDEGLSFSTIVNPLQTVDDWAMLPDGTMAIVRGADYHVDWIDREGRRRSTAPLQFNWQRLSDAEKAAVIDSAEVAVSARRATIDRATGSTEQRIQIVSVDKLPDYRPPFAAGGIHADPTGKVWIRTSEVVGQRAVYDVIEQNGARFDRVQLPHGRVLAGFGQDGTVYMAVIDGNSVRLEQARYR